MKRTRIKPVSKKQAIKNKIWKAITDQKANDLDYICQWSGELGQRVDPERLDYLDGHHKIKRRFNIHTYQNCYIVKRKYHQLMDTIDLEIIPNLKAYKEIKNE